jgi:hypothetical protein
MVNPEPRTVEESVKPRWGLGASPDPMPLVFSFRA